MLKKEITYEDYDGVERTEEFNFFLSESDLMEMELLTDGGFGGMLERIVKAKNTKSLITTFKDLILRSYGEKSLDGKYFIHSEEISAKFAASPAYTKLFMELLTDETAGVEFLKGILPKKILEENQAEIDKAIETKMAELK